MGCLSIVQAVILVIAAWNPGENWTSEVTKTPPGKVPGPASAVLRYSFGWSGIEAGRAKVRFSATRNGYSANAEGGTVGMARTLWTFDVLHRARSSVTFAPQGFEQTETLKTKKNTYTATFEPKIVEAFKVEKREGKTKESKRRFRFEGTLDLLSAYLYLRTLPWNAGDEATIVLFPVFSPYLVHAEAVGREKIQAPTGEFNAIKLQLDVRKIGRKKSLGVFKKFKSAVVWVSDDDDRYVLKVNTDLFIGTIYAELVGIEK